jgi:hypothetical protein
MQLDKTQRGWALGSLGIFAAALVIYLLYAWNGSPGPRGGSAIGLLFGVVGFGFMIFAAALGARKRVPTWRLGRAKAWMKGHLWLGLLALPMILFHGGFHFGGTLTRVLMWLLIVTVASGVYGAVLQNSIPKKMTVDIPLETIYDEISHVRTLLRDEADRSIERLCGDLGLQKEAAGEVQRAGGFTALRPIAASAAPLRTSAAVSAGASAAVAPAPEILLLSETESTPLRKFYLEEMRPFLEQSKSRGQRLADAARTSSVFRGLQTLLPAVARGTLDDLEDICGEARQLLRQESLHRWLHGWLLLHIPLSLALILLGAVHAVMALRY